MKRLFTTRGIAAGAALAGATIAAGAAQADPSGPGPGMCQYLGAYRNVWYPCDQPYYPDAGNPPYGSPLPPWQCQGINAHDVGCS